ncbi:hypothetical protein LY01_00941 [Nonlabens xylanidelens]|uniref:Carboxypeptidase-like protein n=1 Tax=Nonlabens xylanidelens TaxID=191564 RepID=A0A2S6IS68_9FLAO|nr:hypothetical protein [Nonlabens xylanidelens]PPK97114.1 hypothetical protein LY01_00941 [Nonlabens xylanidelens]PQJ13797.1 hypothetical protein BST94_15775 [Nonlabens xylanidelens]
MKLLILFTLLAAQLCVAQVHFKIVNSETKEALVNIPVRFGEKNGMYSNAQGEVTIPDGFEVQQITIAALGYKPYTAEVAIIQNTTVSLKPLTYHLPEVVLRGEPKKVKTFKQKAIRSNSVFDSHWQYHGVEYGVFIPNNHDNADMQLLELTIPFISKRRDWKKENEDYKKDSTNVRVRTLKNDFQYLYRISFYHMNQDSTFSRLSIPPKELIVSDENRKLKMDLEKDQVWADHSGLLIGLHNLGPCDDKGILLSIPRFGKERIGPNGKMYKPINNRENVPHIGVTTKRKGDLVDYINWHFKENSKWEPMRFLGGTPEKTRRLSLGYKLKVITY